MKMMVSKKELTAVILLIALATLFWFIENTNLNSKKTGEWAVYHNAKHGYVLEYPSNLQISEYASGDRISFANEAGSELLTVWIKKTPYPSLDAWFREYLFLVNVRILESQIKIANHEAWVTYMQGKDEVLTDSSLFSRERVTAFIKDGKLFEIFTRSIDYKRVLNSFKFE